MWYEMHHVMPYPLTEALSLRIQRCCITCYKLIRVTVIQMGMESV